jgi:hypothetical protein
MWPWPVIAETEPRVKRRLNLKRKQAESEEAFPFIEDPLPFKNLDEGAPHLKRFASRCTTGL